MCYPSYHPALCIQRDLGVRERQREVESGRGGPLTLVPFWLDQTMNAEVVSLYLAPRGGVQMHLSFIFLQKQMKLRKSHTTKFCTKNGMQFKQRGEVFQLRDTILFDLKNTPSGARGLLLPDSAWGAHK